MKFYPLCFKYFALILCMNAAYGQGIEQDQLSKITYDYTKDNLSGKMPFDQYFKVIFKGIKTADIEKVYFFEIQYENGNKCVVRTSEELNHGVKLPDAAVRFQDLEINKHKEDENSSESIVMPIDPERAYMMTIFKKNSDANHLIVNEYLYRDKSGATSVELNNFFKDDILPLKHNLDECYIGIDAFPSDYSDFITKIAPLVTFYTNPANAPSLTLISLDSIIDAEYISKIANKFKSEEIESNSFKEIMSMFLSGDAERIKSFSHGTNDKVKPFDYNKRLLKLKENISTMENLKKEVETLQLIQNNDSIDSFYRNFVTKELKVLRDNQKNLSKFNGDLKSNVNKYLPEIILVSASTLGNNLETSNSSSLIPDVGLVNALGYNTKGDLKYIGRPYLGLNWHFSGINRSQYLREIPNKKFRHRWSVAIGITLGKIDTEDYEDFYNGISPTLGFNYRLTRQIRAGFGTLFVREKNPNPIVTDTKVELAPFLSVSFDLGLFNEASKLTKLIGF